MSVHLAASIQRGTVAIRADLDVPAGTVTAIVGPNGAGKSTLLRAIAGLQPVDFGVVKVDDVVVDDGDRVLVPPQRRDVGMVFQDYLLFPHLSVRDNAAFGPRSRGLARTQARARAQEELERLGIGELADRRPDQVSGGQAQRIALARALATRPSVLLLDEPMAALDVRARREVRGLLADVLASFPGATVLVSHDVRDALALASRIVVLENGCITQAGTTREVREDPATDYARALMAEVTDAAAD